MSDTVAERIEVTGIVQGVGFRPFVHSLAHELGLGGQVGNDSTRVFIDVFGTRASVDEFATRLTTEAPPLAQIDDVTRSPSPDRTGPQRFSIAASVETDGAPTIVAPDIATCDDCLAELFDPTDRRFGHPFITCTNCGPRFTIIEAMPYDRVNTTMSRFAMCPRCSAEYDDPADRRHHAQPIACPDCGPRLELIEARNEAARADREPSAAGSSLTDPISRAAELVLAAKIVAVRGLGGYHLACDATDDGALRSLRTRKHRPDKPFAVMVPDVRAAARLADLSAAELELLTSRAAPIVLARARPDSGLSPLVAPDNPFVGLMVAYSPVHHLLTRSVGRPLVMTSANPSGEPLATTTERIESLDHLYDARLDHDRPIAAACDDSVVRIVGGRPVPIRRSRGYAPVPVRFASSPAPTGPVLAVGAELKNTVCVAAHGRAWVSQHLGDVANLATLEALGETAQRMCDFYQVVPSTVAADSHPGYLSARWARDRCDQTHLDLVQHHHAHVAAVMAEHDLAPDTPVVGLAFDGTGYGPDDTIWGGEVLVADAFGFERAAHLEAFLMPGGDAAITTPSRIALALLRHHDIAWTEDLAPVAATSSDYRDLLTAQLQRDIGCVRTSSMGRLFDAVASLVGLRHQISFEAQAAIDLEIAAATAAEAGPVLAPTRYRIALHRDVLRTGATIAAIVDDLRHGVDVETIAARFHDAVAAAVAVVAAGLVDSRSIDTVVLSGGVFQNALLFDLCTTKLEAIGITPLTHRTVPPNDGGLSLGQAYIAAHRNPATESSPELPRPEEG